AEGSGPRGLRLRLTARGRVGRVEPGSKNRLGVAVFELVGTRGVRAVRGGRLGLAARRGARVARARVVGPVNRARGLRVRPARAGARLQAEGRAQLFDQLARGLRPVGAILRHRARDAAAKLFGHAGRGFAQRRKRRGDVLLPKLGERAAAQGLAARDQLEEDDAQAIDIRAAVNFGVAVARQRAPLFGRHVVGRAEYLAGDGERGRFGRVRVARADQLGDAEV